MSVRIRTWTSRTCGDQRIVAAGPPRSSASASSPRSCAVEQQREQRGRAAVLRVGVTRDLDQADRRRRTLQPGEVGGEGGQHLAQRLRQTVDRLAARLAGQRSAAAPRSRPRPCPRRSSARARDRRRRGSRRRSASRSRVLARARRADRPPREAARPLPCAGTSAGSAPLLGRERRKQAVAPGSGRASPARAPGRRARPQSQAVISGARKVEVAVAAGGGQPRHRPLRMAAPDLLGRPAAAAHRSTASPAGSCAARLERQVHLRRRRSLRSAPAERYRPGRAARRRAPRAVARRARGRRSSLPRAPGHRSAPDRQTVSRAGAGDRRERQRRKRALRRATYMFG